MSDGIDVSGLNTPGFNRYATMMGIQYEHVEEGLCRCSLEVSDEHFHPGGVVHGGIAFSLADTSMAMALMTTLGSGQQSATIELKISFLAPVRAGTMRCEGKLIRRGRRVAFMESEVRVDENLVATATASFAIIDV